MTTQIFIKFANATETKLIQVKYSFKKL